MDFLPLMWGKERRVPNAEKGEKKKESKEEEGLHCSRCELILTFVWLECPSLNNSRMGVT